MTTASRPAAPAAACPRALRARLPLLAASLVLGSATPAAPQSILDRADDGAFVPFSEMETARDQQRPIGAPGVLSESDVLEAVRRALRDSAPAAERTEIGFWVIDAFDRRLAATGVTDVDRLACAMDGAAAATCTATLDSALTINQERRAELGGIVFDFLSGIDDAGRIAWQTALSIPMRYDAELGWQAGLTPGDLAALSTPPGWDAPIDDAPAGSPSAAECLALGDWGALVGCR